jgi:hypothetical protein
MHGANYSLREELGRECLLARLLESRAISQALVVRLLAWRHPGFGASG